MSVTLTPASTLGFNRPLTVLVKRILTVTNPNDQPVAFKVKTTAPKLYCVRPNSGRIEPGESVDVQVLLQPMKEEPPLNAKCKDKFLVQSTIISPEKESMTLHDFWATLDGQESPVHQQKIKVVYLPPIGEPLAEEEETAAHEPSNVNLMNISYQTSREDKSHIQGIPGLPEEPQEPVERVFSPPNDYSNAQEDVDEPIHAYVPHEPVHEIAPPVSVVEPTPPKAVPPPLPYVHEREMLPQTAAVEMDLRAQLTDAQREISRLRALLESIPENGVSNMSELRHRSGRSTTDRDDATTYGDGTTTYGDRTTYGEGTTYGDGTTTYGGATTRTFDGSTYISEAPTDRSRTTRSTSATAMDPVQLHVEGLSPQVVAVISFAVFLITYVFF